MSFQLENVVPWGRNIDEYRSMFMLSDEDMQKKIAGFGDGPASFNFQAKQQNCSVTSFDVIYQFTKEDLQKRIEEVRVIVMRQMRDNQENYVWESIKSLEELEQTRMSAMRLFLDDYEQGKQEGRYVCHELPNRLPLEENTFDIGLSSHFLLMYTSLGYDFHIKAISEMLRVCKEVRIFPIVDLDANETSLTADVISYFRKKCYVEIQDTTYRFQKGANKMLWLSK